MAPSTAYAVSNGVHVAYQIVGDGPVDLLFVPGWVSHVDAAWDNPLFAPMLERLATFARLIVFDKRGTGASDRDIGAAPLEERMDDVRAVLDAAGSRRAVVFGPSEGGQLAMLFALSHPDRVSHLILYGTGACTRGDDDNPGGYAWQANLTELMSIAEHQWGQGLTLDYFASTLGDVPAVREAWARWERTGASPSAAKALLETCLQIDLRPVIGGIAVPTLVIHHADDRAVPVQCGRDLADRIPGARYWGQPGEHLLGDLDALIGEIQQFVTGFREPADADRVLKTVLFLDIVDSTQHLARMGDRAWRGVLDRFDSLAAAHVARFRGDVVKSTGDGMLALFDGPARAVRAASAVATAVTALGVEIRAGLHTGEVERRHDDVTGFAVHLAARVAAAARPGDVLVTDVVPALVAGAGLRFLPRGEHELKGLDRGWHLYALDEGRGQRTDGAVATHRLERQGASWVIATPDRALHFADAKGWHALAVLLASPHREFHAIDLASRADGRPADPNAGGMAWLDHQAKDAYRRRLNELRTDKAEAEAAGDADAVTRAEEEINALARELSRAIGLGGRDRAVGSSAERARQSVTKTLKGVLDKVALADGDLAAHLRNSVRTGTYCSYTPETSTQIRWAVGTLAMVSEPS